MAIDQEQLAKNAESEIAADESRKEFWRTHGYAGKTKWFAEADQRIARQQQFLAEHRKATVENLRSVRAAVRQARLARGTLTNMGANTGVSGSSGIQGGISSVGSQLSANLSFFTQMDTLNSQGLSAQVDQANATQVLGSIAEKRQRKANNRAFTLGVLQTGVGMATGLGMFG